MTTWPPPGQVHDHVGTEQAVRRRRRPLLLEVAVLGHAGRLDRVAQRHFAPAAPRLRGPQRRDQVPGLLLQLLVAEVQRGHPLVQRGVGALALDFHVPQPALVAGQRLAQRVQELRDRLLALGEIALGGRADLVELGVGQREELLVVLRQRLRRQLREGAGQQVLRSSSARRAASVFGRLRSSSSSDTATARAVSAAAAASVTACSWAASSLDRPAHRPAAPRPDGRRRRCGPGGPCARQRRWRDRRRAR